VSTFDVQVLDVIAGDPGADAPRILFRASGPAIERTGLGPGFSGSPITCGGRVAGAISEAIGEYGGFTALATPIELVLGEPVDPAVAVKRRPRTMRRARTLAAPISLGGLSPAVGALFTRAAARHGRALVAAPAAPPRDAFPPQTLVPGSAMAVGLASGDLSAGAIGTVAYVDGDRVWAFGHPLDGAGRRALLLQDAYVYTVVNNPVAAESITTYKLAAPGHDLGTISGDGPNAVTGRIGPLPPRTAVQVTARDLDTGRRRTLRVDVADEQGLDLPVGQSPLALTAPAIVAQSVASVLGGSPARQTAELCVALRLTGRRAPLRFCRRYVVRGGAPEGGLPSVAVPMALDVGEAVALVDEFNPAALRVERMEVGVRVRRGLRQSFLLDGRAPRVVRRGRTARVRVRVQDVRGPVRTETISVPVPRSTPRGRRTLTLTGTAADTVGELEIDLSELFEEDAEEEPADEAGPADVDALAKRVAALGEDDGVRASFGRGSARVHRDPERRLSGRIRIPVRVR
jgi:hypothetical protein